MACSIESYRQGDVLILRDTTKASRGRVRGGSGAEQVVTGPAAAVDIGEEARQIVVRLNAVNRTDPAIDRTKVEDAIQRHLRALDLASMPVRWVDDAESAHLAVVEKTKAARSAAWSAAESAAWSAAESAAWSAAESAAPTNPAVQRMCGIWLPMADAFTAGLWLFWVCADELIAVPRPSIHIEGERLHRADGPAVEWPNGKRYFFWRGMQVPEDYIMRPQDITVARIDSEQNAERRRVLLDRYGVDRYLRESGAEVVHEDRFGKLLRKNMPGDEPIVMVQVVNSTPEPDGTRKLYMLRVEPNLRPMLDGGQFGEPQEMTAHNAVASTFGLRGEQYDPVMET